MNFSTAIKTCFSKYVDFNGRARRPEYWYFVLFLFIAQFVTSLLDQASLAARARSRSPRCFRW